MTFEEWWKKETDGCEQATVTEKYFARCGWNAALKQANTKEKPNASAQTPKVG